MRIETHVAGVEDYSDLSELELTQTLYEMYYSKRPEDDWPDRNMIRDITEVTGLEYNMIVDKLATKMQNSVKNMAPADLKGMREVLVFTETNSWL